MGPNLNVDFHSLCLGATCAGDMRIANILDAFVSTACTKGYRAKI